MGEVYEAQSWEVRTRLHALEVESRFPPVVLELVATDASLHDDLKLLPSILVKPETISPQNRLSSTVKVFEFPQPSDSIEAFFNLVGNSAQRIALTDLFRTQARVPRFGSSPTGWENIAELLKGGSPLGAALLVGDGQPATLIVAFAAFTIAVRIIDPAFSAIGESLSDWIKRWGKKS